MPIRRLALALAVVLASLLPAGAPAARAAPPPDEDPRERRYPLQVTAEPALGCESAPSGWVPVLVTLSYDDPTAWASGRPAADAPPEKFVVRLVARLWNGAARSVVVREESLSPGTAKRFFLHSYTTDDCELRVLVTRERDGVRAAKEFRFDKFQIDDPNYYGNWRYNQNQQNQQRQPLRIALLSGPKTTALNYLKSIELPNRIEPLLAKIEDPSQVPDRRVGWAPFDMVVLHDYPIAALSPGQQEALRAYVHGGGRLLVSPGPDLSWLTQPFFRDLLPPGRPVSTVRTVFEDQEVAPYAFVRLEGAPRPMAATGPPPERRLLSLEELLPPGFPRALLPQETVWEIQQGLQQVEWAMESNDELGTAMEDVLDASRRLAVTMAAQAPSGTAILLPPALMARTGASAVTATARSSIPRWPAGRGEVSLLPFDLAGGPLKGASTLRAKIWQGLFERYRPRPARGADPTAWPVATSPTLDSSSLRLLLPDFDVPVLAISLLALVYVGVVGPVNFLVLRRLGREPLVVFTVPAIAVLSIFATVVAGYVWQGASARTYEATITHARDGERYASGVRLLGVLSAGSAVVEVPLHPDEDGAAVPTQSGDAADRGFTLLERRRRAVSGVGLSRWEGALLRFDSKADLAGGVSVDVQELPEEMPDMPPGFTGPVIPIRHPPRIFVRNESDRRLSRMRLYWRPGGRWYEAKGAAPGERVEMQVQAVQLIGTTSIRPVRAPDPGRMRRALVDRAWNHAGDWLQTRRSPWALAAEMDPDPPRTFTAPGADAPGGASGPWGDLPAPLERAGLLFLEPVEGA